MKPDPSRQWFVYHNEKEMGPFSEPEILAKLGRGEITQASYVFSEGMTDWALLSETQVLLSQVALTAAPEAPAPPPAAASAPSPAVSVVMEIPPVQLAPAVTAVPVRTPAAADPAAPPTGPRDDFSELLKPAGTNTNILPPGGFAATENTSQSKIISTGGKKGKTNVSKVVADPTLPSSPLPTAKTSKFSLAGKKKLVLSALSLLVLATAGVFWWMQGSSVPDNEFPDTPPAKTAAPKAATAEGEEGGDADRGDAATPPPPAASVAAANPGDAPPEAPAGMPPPPPPGGNKPPQAGNLPPQAPGAALRPAPVADVSWKDLLEFRKVKDSKGAPYALSPKPLGDRFPILVGVLSPLVPYERLFIAVYPTNDRNIMAVPKIWFLETRVVDGFFSAGPLTVEGHEVPAGRYNVLVYGKDTHLGDTSFEIGVWPNPQKYAEIQGSLQNERNLLAEKERSSFEMKLQEIASAVNQLKAKAAVANKGPKGAKEWNSFAKAWWERFNKSLADQEEVQLGPMFYPEAQGNLLVYMKSVKELFEAYTTISQGGSKALAKKKKRPLGAQLVGISKIQGELSGETKMMAQAQIKPFLLNSDLVKKSLEAFAQSKRSVK